MNWGRTVGQGLLLGGDEVLSGDERGHQEARGAVKVRVDALTLEVEDTEVVHGLGMPLMLRSEKEVRREWRREGQGEGKLG